MNREYGLAVWSLGDISFEEKCKISKEIGVEGIEVQGDIYQDPEEIVSLLKKYNLKIFSVTPDNVDISSEDKKIRETAVEYYLNLINWARKIGSPMICVHGEVGKISGSGDLEKDWSYLISSMNKILEAAETSGIEIVYEVLNRYENHQIVTSSEVNMLIEELNSNFLYALLDSYHMNIEEANPVEAIKKTGSKLGMYHVADSNREAIGNGHIDIKSQIEALQSIDYARPIIMEMMATGPDPFNPVKTGQYLDELTEYYKISLKKLKEFD